SRDAAVRRLRAQLVTGSIVGELRHGPRGIAHAHDPPELVVRVRPRGSVGRDEARRVARGVPKETFGVAEGVRDLDDVAEIVVAILPLVPERVLRAREPPVLVTVLPRATLEIGAADRPVLVVVVDAHLAAVRRRRGRETTELVVLERALRDAVFERKHELAPLVVLVLRATAKRGNLLDDLPRLVVVIARHRAVAVDDLGHRLGGEIAQGPLFEALRARRVDAATVRVVAEGVDGAAAPRFAHHAIVRVVLVADLRRDRVGDADETTAGVVFERCHAQARPLEPHLREATERVVEEREPAPRAR